VCVCVCVILKMNTEIFHILKKQNMRYGYMHKILTMKHLSRKIPKYSALYIMIQVPPLVFMRVTPLRPSKGRESSMKSKWNDDWQGRKKWSQCRNPDIVLLSVTDPKKTLLKLCWGLHDMRLIHNSLYYGVTQCIIKKFTILQISPFPWNYIRALIVRSV
jgi:hypothetical protein